VERDLRIDFLRGVVMLVLLVAHVELVSLFTFVAWERVGLVSGAEGFVILAGAVLGMVSRARLQREGRAGAYWMLVERAAQLYRVNLFVIVSVALLALLPWPDTHEVRTFTDRFAHVTHPLYPPEGAPPQEVLARFLLLRAGPHQVQILGLYVVLLALSPAALWLLEQGRARLLLALSLLLYASHRLEPSMPTGAQFEHAFPVLAWQLLYVGGLAAGWHRERLRAFFRTRAGRALFALAALLFLAFLLLAQNNPNPVLPAWTRLSLVPPDTFDRWRTAWFDKNGLGPLRVLNYACLLLVAYWLLGRFWGFFARALGWFFIPIGQASLYVFIVHVYLVLLVSNLVPFHFAHRGAGGVLRNTLVHAGVLATVWLLVKRRVLFHYVPR
jgi:hypothetical protein